MKLITEQTYSDDLDLIKEDIDGKKSYKIKGPFLQSEKLNRNNRIYPRSLLEREIHRYNVEEISKKSSVGELSHPSSVEINPERISHLVESLQLVGNDGVGVAKVLTEFPMGKIVKGMLDEGIKFGVSTRGVGSLNGNKVDDSYRLICIDVVMSPSGPDCYVEGILEGVEYIMDGNRIVEVAINKFKSTLDKKGSRDIYHTLNEFLNDIRKG